MEERDMFAVIVDEISTVLLKFQLGCHLSELKSEDIRELLEMFAETDTAWNDVLAGKRAAVLFDGETMERVRINK